MADKRSVTTGFQPRLLAIISVALFSLCVSNNVGTCFLPLPVVTDCVAENRQRLKDFSFRSTTRNVTDSFRVPIMGHTQKRADKDNPARTVAGTPKFQLVLPGQSRPLARRDSPLPKPSIPHLSQPPGRGPPLHA